MSEPTWEQMEPLMNDLWCRYHHFTTHLHNIGWQVLNTNFSTHGQEYPTKILIRLMVDISINQTFEQEIVASSDDIIDAVECGILDTFYQMKDMLATPQQKANFEDYMLDFENLPSYEEHFANEDGSNISYD